MKTVHNLTILCTNHMDYNAGFTRFSWEKQVPPEGSEHPRFSLGNTQILDPCGPLCGPLVDPELLEVVEAWPSLDETIRKHICEMARSKT